MSNTANAREEIRYRNRGPHIVQDRLGSKTGYWSGLGNPSLRDFRFIGPVISEQLWSENGIEYVDDLKEYVLSNPIDQLKTGFESMLRNGRSAELVPYRNKFDVEYRIPSINMAAALQIAYILEKFVPQVDHDPLLLGRFNQIIKYLKRSYSGVMNPRRQLQLDAESGSILTGSRERRGVVRYDPVLGRGTTVKIGNLFSDMSEPASVAIPVSVPDIVSEPIPGEKKKKKRKAKSVVDGAAKQKDSKPRAKTSWDAHVLKIRGEHHGMLFKDVLQLAKTTYVKPVK